MFRVVAVLFLLISQFVAAADITVDGPPAPIAVGALDVIFVGGLTTAEFEQSSITVAPGESAKVIRGSFGGQPAMLFRAGKAGSYTVTVGQNVQHLGWQKSLGLTLQQATDVNLTGPILDRLKQLSIDAAVAFPSRGGSCVVIVGTPTPNPNPNPTPTPSPDEPSAQLQTLVSGIREALRANPTKAEKLKHAYAGLREVVKQDAGAKITDTAALQKLHAGMLDEVKVAEPPMVGDKIDEAIALYLGIRHTSEGYESKALTPADVAKFADICNALSWACGKAAVGQ